MSFHAFPPLAVAQVKVSHPNPAESCTSSTQKHMFIQSRALHPSRFTSGAANGGAKAPIAHRQKSNTFVDKALQLLIGRLAARGNEVLGNRCATLAISAKT